MQICSMADVGIISTGICMPEKIMTNADLEKMVDTSDEWIRTRSGIEERRIADEGIATSDLAIESARMALKNAGMTPEEIDLIILGTVTPDMAFPATACVVQDRLGASRAAAFDFSAGCSGFVYGMAIGTQFIQTGMYKNVMLIGSETLSRIINWKDRNTCVLFGDGAGTVILKKVEKGYGVKSFDLGSDGSGGDFLKQPMGGSRIPITEDNYMEDGRFLCMNGREVFKFAVRIIEESVMAALNKAGLERKDIDCFVPHQANTRIIESAARRLDISMEKVYVNVNKYGNTSAASIPVALHEAFLNGSIKKGDNVVLVGFGAGLTWGASVLKWAI